MQLSRRQFLSRGTALAAGGLTVPLWAQWFGEQMEKLAPRKYVQLPANPYHKTGLEPVAGQPGLFYDWSTGKYVNLRDFRESDAYDTIVIPQYAGGKLIGNALIDTTPGLY